MAVAFREVFFPPLEDLSATAPDAVVIGILGENGAGKSALLRLAAGVERPLRGEVSAGTPSRLLGPADELDLSPARTLLMEHALARHDALVRAQAMTAMERLRRQGSTVLIVSHEEELLRAVCDEIWWVDDGKLMSRGDPGEVLEKYRSHIAKRIRAWGEATSSPLVPSMRRGDGRAEVLTVETLDSRGQQTMVWQSGESVSVRVAVRFHRPIDDPVVGIMIRTRIGFEVYGTNTELEHVKLGPCAAGETLRLLFSFRCDLCPQEYTLTVASHDPDGVWHDWLEEAVAFSVTDSRYTVGVANLRAGVAIESRNR